MAEKLFPERQRCKKCGKGLGLKSTDPVYLGLYCTPRCAGIAVPATRPQDAPRVEVFRRQGSSWLLTIFEAGASVTLTSIGATFSVDELYADPRRA